MAVSAGSAGSSATTSGTAPVRSASSAVQRMSIRVRARAKTRPAGIDPAREPVAHQPLGRPVRLNPEHRAGEAGGGGEGEDQPAPDRSPRGRGRGRGRSRAQGRGVGGGGDGGSGAWFPGCSQETRRGQAGSRLRPRRRAFCSANSAAVRMPASCSSASFFSRLDRLVVRPARRGRRPRRGGGAAAGRRGGALAGGDLARDRGGGAGDDGGAGGGLGGAADQAGAAAAGSEHGFLLCSAAARSEARASAMTAWGMRSARTSSPLGGADGGGEAGGPDVLEEQRGGGRGGGQVLGDLVEVGLGEEAAEPAVELDEGGGDLGRELLHLEDGDGAVGVLGDHGEVDQADQPVLDEVGRARARCRR